MFTAQIENVKGEILTLTNDEANYQVVNITGLNPPNAQINTSTIAGLDGARFNSSKLETRQIVITLKINGDIESNRQNLYTYFSTKQWCKFYYSNANRNVYIDCYVQTVECNLFTNNEVMQIALLCPQPYFKNMNEIVDDISKVISEFDFPFAFGSKGATNPYATILSGTDNAIPFSIIDTSRVTDVYNESDSEIGVIIEVDIYSNVNTIQIRNTVTGDNFTLNYDFEEDDKVLINTNKGEKSISLVRNGMTTNLFSALQKGSTFFQLALGDNYFSYTTDNGDTDNNVHILFKHYTMYRGV